MAIRGVTVLGDVMRPTGQGAPGGSDRPAAWLHSAVRRQIERASGLAVDLLTPTTSPELAAWIEAVRSPCHADAVWAAVFDAAPDDALWRDDFMRLVIDRLRERVCVGYELPPYLTALLDHHAIPYVDIRIHPVRFMDDLLFAVRACDRATRAALAENAVAEVEVIATAGLREAMCRLIADAGFPHPTLVVVGQRRFDSTQIVDGGFFDAAVHAGVIADICARHRAVLLKPHPHDREHSLLTVAAATGEGVLGCVRDNLYRLLAAPEIASVLTVSSSVAYEAPYFGKAVFVLGRLPIRLGWRGDDPAHFTHASLDDYVLSLDFWRVVLAPHAPVTPCDGMRLGRKPNRLRIALDSFWNYNEIDTDRLPRPL